jgi:hypothetical protein
MLLTAPKRWCLARAVIRLNNGAGFALREVTDIPDIPAEHVTFLAELVAEGLLREDGPERWVPTAAGMEMRTTSRTKLTRERADSLLQEFLARVEEVNRTPTYAFRVATVVVFGSYLTDRLKIGDVDLAVVLSARESDAPRQRELEKSARVRCVRPRNMTEHICFPTTEVYRTLKGGSAFLELHEGLHELDCIFESGARPAYRVLVGEWVPPSLEVLERNP